MYHRSLLSAVFLSAGMIKPVWTQQAQTQEETGHNGFLQPEPCQEHRRASTCALFRMNKSLFFARYLHEILEVSEDAANACSQSSPDAPSPLPAPLPFWASISILLAEERPEEREQIRLWLRCSAVSLSPFVEQQRLFQQLRHQR